MSNISLANNGTHISLSSEKMGKMMSDPSSGFGTVEEKYFGIWSSKSSNIFFPCLSTPIRQTPTGWISGIFIRKRHWILAHELDYTHLRMLCGGGKKGKAEAFGYAMTPMGPLKLDKVLSRIFGLQGDLVTDFRLIDYLVCLLSTEQSPA